MITAKRYFVQGRVQGVGFRFFVEETASRLGLTGFVRNLSDGRVEVYAVGEESVLNRLRDQLQVGPRSSRVEQVVEIAAEVVHSKTFCIERSL